MKKAYAPYILSLLLFGSNGILASHIGLSSFEIVFWRTLIGSLFLLLAARFGKPQAQARTPVNRRHRLYVTISGMAMGVSWMLLYEAYAQIGVSVASLAYYCGPIIILVLAPLVFRERITGSRVLGLAVVMLGLLFVNGGNPFQSGIQRGFLLGLLSAVFYAVMVIFNKMATSLSGIGNATLQLSAGFVTVAAFVLLRQGVSLPTLSSGLVPMLLLGLVNTGVGCYLYFSSIRTLTAASVSIIGYLEPLAALAFSALFLNERLSSLQMAGALLILGGAAFGELYRGRAQANRQPVVR